MPRMAQIWRTEARPRLMLHSQEAPKFLVKVTEFVPRPDDITSERWKTRGSEVVIRLPCYESDKPQTHIEKLSSIGSSKILNITLGT